MFISRRNCRYSKVILNQDLKEYILKELSFCKKKRWVSDFYIFAIWCCRRLIFKIMNSAWSNSLSLKYQRFTSSEAELKEFEPRFKVSRFKPALNWNRFLADFSFGSNSLNSGSGCKDIEIRIFEFVAETQFLYL